MLLTKNAVILLCGLRFPENAGMVARACANMGCTELRLVCPERYDYFKAFPLATAIGRPVLEKSRIFTDLSSAVEDLSLLFGTSARLGDRRKKIINPSQFIDYLDKKTDGIAMQAEKKFGLVFGPEDRGLSNKELSLCEAIIHIPTATHSSSLNIAQAVLVILYELFRNGQIKFSHPKADLTQQRIHIRDLELLENEASKLLIMLDVLPANNSSYFFSQWHDMLCRLRLKRHEFDALMGLCRQLKNKCVK